MDIQMEENDDYVPCDSPMDAKSFVRNRLIDADEEDDVRIHYTVLCNDHNALRQLLKEEGHENWLNFRVRPFSSTPLRLAATVGSVGCVSILLEAGALIDIEDIKGQTPLFIATSQRNLAIMQELLKWGANPEGSILNRGTPLLIAVRDGYAEGVRLLLQHGASCEPFNQINTCVPGWPLHHSIVYAHFSCFLALIKGGAVPNLKGLYDLPSPMIRRLSIPHAIIKYASNKPEFVQLYYDCGGDLTEVKPCEVECLEESLCLKEILRLQKNPRSLKSICRPKLIQNLGKKFPEIERLEIPQSLHSFLRYEEYDKFASRTEQNFHVKIGSEE